MLGMLVICIKRILFRALISLNLFYILFVRLGEVKDVNDSVSGQMFSSKYARSQWWRELTNGYTTLRTLLLTFTFFFTYLLLQFTIDFSYINFASFFVSLVGLFQHSQFDSHWLVLLWTHFSYGILSLLLHNVYILLLSKLKSTCLKRTMQRVSVAP